MQQHGTKSLLRFITCGSVDDGKSTLIGRLLHGTQGEDIDFALLVDGLAAEREQGIIIDVAYRFFGTDKRKFIVADCPGHEQYTRNMATGASTADLAVVLIDARKGLLTQTRRHSYIVSLLGIRHVLLAVNKMDLVGYNEKVFDDIVTGYRELADNQGIPNATCIPLSALKGDNILERSPTTPWYTGETLLEHLENLQIDAVADETALRMPVQWVCRPDQDLRGFAGTIAAGQAPRYRDRGPASGQHSKIARIVTVDGDLETADAGQAVTLTLADEIDASRGDVIAAASNPAEISDQFAAHLLWLNEQPLLPGRP